MKVKEEVERCLEAGTSKEQLFRVLREKGSHPAATFAGKLAVRFHLSLFIVSRIIYESD